jgi:sialate O-acetylesterase
MRLAIERLALCVLAYAGMPGVAHASTLLHAIFQDHVVLQRDKPIDVWGEAAPGATLTLSLAGQTTSTQANEIGSWRATLPALAAGGPHDLSVRTQSGEIQTVRDVLIGDV